MLLLSVMSHPKYTHRDEEEPATVYYYNKQNKTGNHLQRPSE